MAFNRVHFSSETDEWATPTGLFERLNHEFQFTLDVAASNDNHKCERYFTKKSDALKQSWAAETCWMNPPYGDQIVRWVRKAFLEATHYEATIVSLLPARTDSNWFHKFILGGAAMEIHFLKGRLKFGNAENSAPFPSIITVHSMLDEMRGKVARALGKKAGQLELF